MKNIFSSIIQAIGFIFFLQGNTNECSASVSHKDDQVIQSYLYKLDKSIYQRYEFYQKKEDYLHTLEDKLKVDGLTLGEKYSLNSLLFKEYSTYKYDSMFVSSSRLIQIANEMNDKNKLVESQIKLGYSYLWGGLFKDAYEYSQSIDTIGVSVKARIDYLMFLFNLDFECGLYAKYDNFLMSVYERKMITLIDCLDELLPINDERRLEIRQKECFQSNKFKEAYRYSMLRFKYKDMSKHELAVKLGDAGFICLEVGDTVNAVKYMVDASVLDIELGKRQAPSLRRLAETLYSRNELKGAHQYIQLAMDNAQFFGSRYRMYEASIILPTIDRNLNNQITYQKRRLQYIVGCIVLMLIFLIVAIWIIYRQYYKLQRTKIVIEKQYKSLVLINEQIEALNRQLLEVNRIKEAYLGKTLADNSNNIKRMEDLGKSILRKLKIKQYDSILTEIEKGNYSSERERMIKEFDCMFLDLYPNFIIKFNELLKEENRITIEAKNELTPELRIFALIRLGINKNDTIADILDYSISTVKNYKTKIRNNSIVSNDEFENELMKIEIFQ